MSTISRRLAARRARADPAAARSAGPNRVSPGPDCARSTGGDQSAARPASDRAATSTSAAKKTTARAVAGPETPHDAPRRVLRAGPVVAVAHAGRPVEQDHDLAGAAGRRRPARRRPDRNGRANASGDQREREDAQREQRPVANRAAAHRLVRDPAQEHQRRERHDRPPLALHEVHDDRNRDGEQSGEQGGCEERHQRARLRRSRADR